MSKTEHLHFTIGEDFGSLLYNLANEKIVCDYDMLGAIKVLEDSLMGITRELVINIISGKMVLSVDEKTQEVIVSDHDKNIHPEPFDWGEWCRSTYHRAKSSFDGFHVAENWTRNTLAKFYQEGGFDVNVSIRTLTDYVFAGDETDVVEAIKDDILDSWRQNDKVVQCRGTAVWAKQLVEKTIKFAQLIQYIGKLGLWDDTVRVEMYSDYLLQRCEGVTTKMSSISNGVFDTEEDTDLKSYINSAIAVAETIKKGIKPVDFVHDSVYDAYWISPEGEAYGLNGHIANMLHYQLADAIINQKEIDPKSTHDENNVDAYRKLEELGWAKITNNWVQFDGNHCKFTEAQQKTVGTIGMKINFEKKTWLRIGYRDAQLTGANFKSMDLVQIQKHFTI